MAHRVDRNSNMRKQGAPRVSFALFYDKAGETLNIHTVKVNDISPDRTMDSISVQFKVKDWTCETQVKTARTCDVIWNERFSQKLKYKHIAKNDIHVKVLKGQSSEEIGEATLSLEDVKVDEKTVCSLYITSREHSKVSKGEIVFSVHPSDDAVHLTIAKAKNLPRVMREYVVLARLLSASESEKRTSIQKSAVWNEKLSFKGKDARRGVLVLQVIGEKTNERQTLGEVRLNISDVKQKEYGRILALQEPKVDSISFSTTFTQEENNTDTLMIRIFGLENINSPEDSTNVYVQVKQKCEGVVVKKEKTSKTKLVENPSFKSNRFTFTLDREKRSHTKLLFSVKTQKSAYATDKPVIGKVVVGPLSEGKWYKDILKVKNKEISHSLQLEIL